MLDIIIPTYKNKAGLQQTLKSINKSLLSEINITIIDDDSKIYYNDILEEFSFVTVFYNQTNMGPGLARSLGISITREPYIMFIDTGDYFIDDDVQQVVINTIKENSDVEIFSWQYIIDKNISKETNNHLHGKIYKRDFLKKYNIDFCNNTSFANEDIGFNRLCRLIVRDKELKTLTFEDPILVYDKNENSITNKNNGEFFYKQQNKSLALTTINTIKLAEKNNVSQELILEEINSIMTSLYYTFIRTLYERPEFKQEAWDGAKLFYNECFSKYNANTVELIVGAYNHYVKKIYMCARKWKNFKPLNLNRFLKDLNKYNKVPSQYYN